MLSISVSFRLTPQFSDLHTAIGRPRLVNVFDLPFVWHDLPTRLVVHRPLATMDEVAHGTVNKHFGPKLDRPHFAGLSIALDRTFSISSSAARQVRRCAAQSLSSLVTICSVTRGSKQKPLSLIRRAAWPPQLVP